MFPHIATTNPGILYVSFKPFSESQISPLMKRVMEKAKTILGKNMDRRYTINSVKYGDKALYAYVFIESRELINIMQGLNPDGTTRIQKDLDKNCKYVKLNKITAEKKRKQDLDKVYKKYLEYSPDSLEDFKKSSYFGGYYGGEGKGKLWSDFQEEEDNVISDYEPKYIKKQLKPLWEKYVDSSIKNVDLVPASSKIPDDNVIPYVLEAKYVDNNVTNEIIRKVFLKYDTKKKYELVAKGSDDVERIYYPIVTRVGNTVRVKFDPDSTDARFAIHMQRKTTINGHNLVFNFPTK